MSSEPWHDPDILEELYWEEGMSLLEIGDELGCSNTTVKRWMDRHDISTRTAPYHKPPCFHTDDRGYESWRHEIGDKEDQYRVRVHRLVAVAEYGFDAVVEMDIHHENGIPWDNRPCNVFPISHQDHGKLHGNN